MTGKASGWFSRWLLPGLAFKAAVIGGGYATGREIAEFFLPAGPWGGLAGLALATLVWSGMCVLTFLFARASGARDYRTFFKALLGRGWVAFELAYALFVVLVLAVFGAAAGEIGHAVFDAPRWAGMLALLAGVTLFAAFGTRVVEQLFAWVSILLYGVYGVFLVLALTTFGHDIAAAFAVPVRVGGDALVGGATYAGYNIIGAVIVLPMTRHLLSDRDAVVAGLVAGPLAMIPAIVFFVCMCAYAPEVGGAALPSDVLLAKLDLPVFRLLFQLMVFAALLESGTGAVHAINERVAGAVQARLGRTFGVRARALCALGLLVFCMVLAERVGLVGLIAGGYRLLAYALIALYVVPLATVGLLQLVRRRPALLPEVP
ncbi:membrane protein [Caulobacter sp. UNC358MFTsu5.1]|uniref:YkvI family membrane protein n=1 Tax=Caulobacter sp. UNC358MFTsu5.1 TaxID=1449049 RepID=UPI0004A77888|nr:membrane protein [Caulobacter sp. UNC358MFTsu5.1]